ncbi:macrophage mannose receptor 1-like [Carettochelys insculpta]|uniref:macrophage mannose receptor 1-like n=1 Tax=Carettochelys insculpta TaxID=44489 RepID=UPI003EB811D7
MAVYLLLTFLSLLTTSVQVPGGGVFLIYNEDHKLCIKTQNSNSVIMDTCDPADESQKFRWVSDHRILSLALKSCLGVPSVKDQAAITLSPCNKTSKLQQWECRNETLLAVQGEDLFFISAQKEERKVMLAKGSGLWNRWKIYGTTGNLCSQDYEDMFTLLGNAFGAPCVFPFKFNNKWYAECTKDKKAENELDFPWCATSTDFDKDSLFGYCPLKNNTDKDFWTANPVTDVYYQINSNSALTWHQARKSCQQQNAELLSITELHEQTYLTGLTGKANSELWIGFNNLSPNGGWQWAGGSPFRFLNWAPGSPSLESEKICGMLQSENGKWANQQCDRKGGYICKKGNSSLDSHLTPSGDFRPVKCPSGWIPYSGHCYIIYRTPKIWKDALSSCRKEGGDLASIHNIEEYSFTVSQLGYKPTDELWIGLNDLKIQMYFEWSDGSPVTYTRWLREEPSQTSNRQEDCVVMKGEDGYWADDICENKLGYICKMKPLAEESEVVEAIVPGCQKGWIRHGFYCYSVGQTPVTFSEAKKICEENKGYLVTVQDRYEQAFLTVLIGFNPKKYFWIALSDVEEPGTFKWADGDAVQFTHWNSGMPGREPGCVAMRTGMTAGLWDVVKCDEKSMFLCKQLVEGGTPPPIPTTSPAPSCPDEWHSTAHSSSCFKLFQKGRKHMKTWFEARDFCRAIGGDLATIHSEEEQNVINKLDRAGHHNSYWMGLSALDPDGGFTWSDGSPVNYENWLEGEPNNYHGNEKCGTFLNGYPGMQWNDMYCERLCDWICQIRKGATLKPEPNTTFDYTYKVSEDSWIVYEDKEYYFSHKPLPMEKAREHCKKNSGDLVVIESESERRFLWKYSFFYEFGDSLYIGLSVSLDKKFSWMDGTPVNFVAWAPNEPNFANNDENCVVIYTTTGTWNDLNCGVPQRFICERLHGSAHATLAPSSPAPLGGCPQNWHLFNNKCFRLFGVSDNTTLTWHAARKACVKLEGNLASIPSEEEQAFLITHFTDVSMDAWIGLNDINSEYTFLWTDGRGVYYTNWAKGLPNYRGQADCVSMIKNPTAEAGKWKDADCKTKKSYICQRNADPKLYNSQPTVPVSGFTHYCNSSYSLISSRMTWEEAQNNCKAEYSELASILDPYAQSFLWLQVLKIGQPVWIGLNSNVTDGIYKWTDNWKIKYSKWASEEPKKKSACVYLDVDGTWKTGSCGESYFSVCKRSDVVAPTDPPQLPGKCPASTTHRSWVPYHGHCYSVESSSMESWPRSSMECIRLGATLISIKNSAEMNFLINYLNAFAEDSRQFWIGMYKNVDGEWKWIDNSAVDFVNWKKGEPTDGYQEQCVDMDASDGGWRSYHCSAGKRFICKMPKITEVEPSGKPPDNKALKTDEAVPAPAHNLSGVVVILILLILIGTGLAGCFFYKKRNNQLPTDVSFDNTLYCNRDAVPATSESKYLVANIDENEQAML